MGDGGQIPRGTQTASDGLVAVTSESLGRSSDSDGSASSDSDGSLSSDSDGSLSSDSDGIQGTETASDGLVLSGRREATGRDIVETGTAQWRT